MNRRNQASNMHSYQSDSHHSSSISRISQYSPEQHPSVSILHKMAQAQKNKNVNNNRYDKHSAITAEQDESFDDQCDHEEGNNEGEVEKLSEAVQALIIKNKLNSKNAFDVPLIDVSTLKVIKNNDDNSWNKISTVLQNSSKVYGLRVDFMTDSLNKMTNNINRNEQTNDQNAAVSEKKHNPLQDIDYDQNSSPNHNFKLKQIYDKHLEKGENKMIEENVCNKANHSQLQIRRMFDQNGISGLLLSRMPITSNLNVSIDPSISYPQSINKTDKLINFQFGNFTDLSILSEIDKLKIGYFSEEKKDQFELDCYNVDFQADIEVFRCALDEEDNLMDMFEQKNDEIDTFDIENPQFQRFSNHFQSNRSSMQTSNSQPFNNLFDEINATKNKRKKGKPNSKKAKQKKGQLAKQEILINFDQKFVEKTKEQIFLTNLDNKHLKQKKLKEKNVYKTAIPPIMLQYANSYTPPQDNQTSQSGFHSQCRLENHKNQMSFQRGEQLSVLMQGFTGMCTSQIATALTMPNIKTTKLRLLEDIQGQAEISFEQLYSDYEMKFGSSSEAILFLSVLHLCNQNNLSLFPKGEFDLMINNPTPIPQSI